MRYMDIISNSLISTKAQITNFWGETIISKNYNKKYTM